MSTHRSHVFAVPGVDHIIDTVNPDTGRSDINGDTLAEIQARAPGAVLMEFDQYMTEKAARQNTPIQWKPCTKEKYWNALEVLPPACQMGGGFLLGEPMDHSASTGQPRFSAYLQRGKEYVASDRPITIDEFRALFVKSSAHVAATLEPKRQAQVPPRCQHAGGYWIQKPTSFRCYHCGHQYNLGEMDNPPPLHQISEWTS